MLTITICKCFFCWYKKFQVNNRNELLLAIYIPDACVFFSLLSGYQEHLRLKYMGHGVFLPLDQVSLFSYLLLFTFQNETLRLKSQYDQTFLFRKLTIPFLAVIKKNTIKI